MGVLMAESMAQGYNLAYTDQWASVRAERDEVIKADQQMVAQYYQEQQRAKEDREAREDALAQAERQRTGY
jgi:hypothetical protein